jgi:hypothetical protein
MTARRIESRYTRCSVRSTPCDTGPRTRVIIIVAWALWAVSSLLCNPVAGD